MKRGLSIFLCLLMTVFPASASAQAGAPAKVIPIERLQTARTASADYPEKAREVRAVIPRPSTGDGAFDAKTQKLAENYEKELSGLDVAMREASMELRRDQVDRSKLKALSGKIERHVKALKKRQSDMKAHLAKAITSERNSRRTFAGAYETFDRKAGELHDVVAQVLKNLKEMK